MVTVTGLRLPSAWRTAQANNASFDISANELNTLNEMEADANIDWQTIIQDNIIALDAFTVSADAPSQIGLVSFFRVAGGPAIQVPGTQLRFVDDAGTLASFALGGSLLNSVLDMGANQINNMADPGAPQDAATQAYVDAQDALITGANVGAGTGLSFRDKVGDVLNFKSLIGGTNVTVTDNADDITIDAASAGEANLGANVGAGEGDVFRDKTGVTLNFKTILAGTNITVTNNADTVEIASAAGVGEANTISSQGGGTFPLTATVPKSGVDLRVISVSNGNGMNAALATDVLTLAVASTVVETDQANVYGDFDQTFRSSRLRLSNPANTFFYELLGSAITADRQITLPLLTANDEMVTRTFNKDAFVVSMSDLTTTITTGTSQAYFRCPAAFTITEVRASVLTQSSSGVVTVDINEAGVTILSTKITIDANESSSQTAAIPPVISDTLLADDAEITFDIDTAGTGAAGLIAEIIGFYT